MNDDDMFRVVLLLVFLFAIPVGVYHRLKSQATRETLDRRQEGLFILATLRPAGIAFWLGTMAWITNPDWLAWSSVPIPAWLRWTAVVVITATCGLLVWTFRCLGKNLTDTVVTRRTHTLVTDGPYRWVRHPFYDAAALLMLSVSLTAANWFLLATGGAVLCLLIVRTRIEEQNLLARFGESYRAYAERTGRFVPKLAAHRRGA